MKNSNLLIACLVILVPLLVNAGDRPVAEIYGQDVYEKDLALPAGLVKEQQEKMSPEEFARWKQDAMRQTLAYGVMEEARKHFLKKMDMQPTAAEIDSYLSFMARAKRKEKAERKERRAGLEAELKQPGLSEEKRKAIEEELELLTTLDGYEKEPATEAERKAQEKAERDAAGLMVSNWKFNQALYRKYGGRVVFQQAGLEPIDAHKAFVEELKKSGDYRILDPAYDDLFRELDDYFSRRFDFVDEARAREYFDRPWWEAQQP